MSHETEETAAHSPVSRGTILMTYIVIFVYLDLVSTKLFFGPLSPEVNRAVVLKSLLLFSAMCAVAAYSTKITGPETGEE